MKRIRLTAPYQMTWEEAPTPEITPDEALVRVEVVGICGSDTHAYRGRHPFITLPVVPGHEFTGTVVETGDEKWQGWVGKRVTAVPSLVCGQCFNCQHGRYNICNELRVIGCQADGAMAEFVKVPVEMLVELPTAMSFETGALVEPLAVAVGAVQKAGSVAGSRLVVFGAGPIGLFVLQVAKAYGPREVIVVEPQADRRQLALQLGADVALDPAADIVAHLQDRYGPDGIDLSFECVGVASTVNTAIRINRKGTRVIVVGVFETDVNISLGLLQDREIELIGTLMYRQPHFKEAMRLLQSGKVQGAALITHRFELSEAAEAFALLERSDSGALKVLLHPDR